MYIRVTRSRKEGGREYPRLLCCPGLDLQRCLDKKGIDVSWPEMMRDLKQVQSVLVELEGKRYRLRTDLKGVASSVFMADGVRPPSVVEYLGNVS